MEAENPEDLHGIVLRTAFSNLLSNHLQLQVITAEGKRLCFNQHLFLLFSPLLRSLLSSLPQGEHLTIILPDSKATTVMILEDLLSTGATSTTTGARESQEVVEAAAELGISMSSLQGPGGERVGGLDRVLSDNLQASRAEKTLEKSQIMHNLSTIETAPEPPEIKKEPDTEEMEETNCEESNNEERTQNSEEPEPNEEIVSNREAPKQSESLPNSEASKVSETEVSETVAKFEAPVASVKPPNLESVVINPPVPTLLPPVPTPPVPTPPTTESSSEPTPPKEFQCLKCQKSFDNLMHLRSHYCLHFKMILKKRFNNLSPDNRCTECSKQPLFASSDRLLLHVGVHHRKIDDILRLKGITLPTDAPKPPVTKPKVEAPASPLKLPSHRQSSSPKPPGPSSPKPPGPSLPKPPPVTQDSPMNSSAPRIPSLPPPTPAPSSPLFKAPNTFLDRSDASNTEINTESDPSKFVPSESRSSAEESRVNCDLKCEVCGQDQKSESLLEQHCCRHFMKELKDQYASLMDGGKCNICGNSFKQQHSLLLHIGCKHGKINEVLNQKGFASLPCPVTNSHNAAMQRQLIKIKKERQESMEEDNMDTEEATIKPPSEQEGDAIETTNKTDELPTQPSTLDEILRKYKFTTGSASN